MLLPPLAFITSNWLGARSLGGWSCCRPAKPLAWSEFWCGGVRFAEQLVVAHGQGLRFAMSPISCPLMWEQADALGLTFVPGVFSPTEVHRAGARGAVKLFPAASLGRPTGVSFMGRWLRCRFVLQLVVFDLQISVPGLLLGWTLWRLDPRCLINKTSCMRHAEQLEPYLHGITTTGRRCRSESQVLHLNDLYLRAMAELKVKLSDKALSLIAQLQKEIFNRRRKKVTPSGVVRLLWSPPPSLKATSVLPHRGKTLLLISKRPPSWPISTAASPAISAMRNGPWC